MEKPESSKSAQTKSTSFEDLLQRAEVVVREGGKASTSYLQFKLGIAYAPAARVMEALEARKIIGPPAGVKPREVYGAGNRALMLSAREEDAMYETVELAVIAAKEASIQFLQAKFDIGYARAACLLDILEYRGVIGADEDIDRRRILITAIDADPTH